VIILFLILSIISIILAIFTIKAKDTIHAILALMGLTLVIGIIYLIMGAFYVGIFQLSIYTAAMTIVFLIAEYVTRR